MKFPIDYPAQIADWNSWDYGSSVNAGIAETKRVISYVSEACPNARFVVAGYSQGAEIASRVINDSSFGYRSRIFRVAVVGNPKYNQWSSASVPVGEAGVGKDDVGGGIALYDMAWDSHAEAKVRDVCIDEDFVCDPSWHANESDHYHYTSRIFPGTSTVTITKWLGKWWLGNA